MAYSTNYTASSGWANGSTANDVSHVADIYAELGSGPSGGAADVTTRLSTMVESDGTGLTSPTTISNIVAISQTNYDAIGTPDANTIYVINGA